LKLSSRKRCNTAQLCLWDLFGDVSVLWEGRSYLVQAGASSFEK